MTARSTSLAARIQSRALTAFPWAIAIAVYFFADEYLALGTNAIVMILLTLSVDLALGYAGIITLGHAAFFGAGAYAAGIIALRLTNDAVIGLGLATLGAAALGALTGALILHTEGVALLMLTLAISGLLLELGNHATEWTGGADGLSGMTIDPLFDLFRFDLFKRTAYLYSLVVLLLWFAILRSIVTSPFGRCLDGIRQSPARMRAIGTPVWQRRVVAYTLSAAMAGSAGALSAQTTRFVGLNTLSVLVSGNAVVMLILGGPRRRYGAFLGALVYVIFQDQAAELNPFHWMLFVGLLLMLTVAFLEGGLASLPDAATRWASRPRSERRRP